MNFTPDELDILRRAMPLIARLTADVGPAIASDLVPARWFTANTMVTADMLAHQGEKVGRLKRDGQQNLYSRRLARERWGYLWIHPGTRRAPE